MRAPALVSIGFLAWLVAGLPGCAALEKSEHKPHVLLIMVDDMNHYMGALGNRQVHTPNMDHLANKGAIFTNAYCQFPLCNPSRSSMLTGLRPSTLGISSLKGTLNDSLVTLPGLFKSAGYFTARAGKIFHMGVPDAIAIRSSGKDVTNAWDSIYNAPGYELNSNGAFTNATPWESHHAGTGGAISWLRAEKADALQHDDNVTTKILQWMKESKNRPVFLAAGFIRPHVPLVAPKRYFELYDSMDIHLPETFAEEITKTDVPKAALDQFGARFGLSREQAKQAVRAYYACISFVDHQIGRLLLGLREAGIADRTIVVFVSDHGFQLGEHGLWYKNYLYRESARAPLIIYAPKERAFQHVELDEPVELLDIYPTLAALAGLSPPHYLEGTNLSPYIRDQKGKGYAVVETRHGSTSGKALYTSRFSYMQWEAGGEELYDLIVDPGQQHNIVHQAGIQSKKDSLANVLNDLIK